MATFRNKRKLAAVARETQEERLRNGRSRNTSVPRINEEYITQVSEEIESRFTKKTVPGIQQDSSPILGALSKLDEFLLTLEPTGTDTLRNRSGTQTWKTRNQMRIVPRMILILRWDPPSISHVVQLIQAQTMLLTFCIGISSSVQLALPW